MKEKKHRITIFTAVFMVLFAGSFDLLEIALALLGGIGLIVNRLVVIMKWIMYTTWLLSLNVPILSFSGRRARRKALVLATTFIVGMIPILGILPEFTLGVLVTILMTRFEDATGVSTLAVFQARKVLKKGGRRLSRKRALAQARSEARGQTAENIANVNRIPNRRSQLRKAA